MKFAASILLAVFAVCSADEADVTQSLSITVPHGLPRFAIVARIEDDGHRVTIGQNGHFGGGGTILTDQPELEARAYTVGGRKLEPNTLHKRLSADSVVLISTDGNFPSREYTQYLKPRTVVFVFKTGGLFPPADQQFIHLKLAENKKPNADQ